MKVEIITVGDELLWGGALDTNAAYLGRRLLQLGLLPGRQTTVGDDPESIRAALTQAIGRSQLILITGGLGSTEDDLTRAAVAQALGRRLILDEHVLSSIRQQLNGRGQKMLASHQRLALLPQGAKALENPVGMAPGLFVDAEGTSLYILPGVPHEMKAIFDGQIAPALKGMLAGKAIRRKRLRTVGVGETNIAEKLRGLRLTGVTLSYLPGPWSVDLWLTARAPLAQEAEELLSRATGQIEERLENLVYGVDDDTLELVVAALLMMKSANIAVAESCTGGSLADRLTDVPGSSAYFERGVVAYSNRAKREILKVPKRTLDRYGAVSQETAQAMAEGVRRISGAQLGLSTTGIAGPAGETPDKPVGLMFVGLSHAKGSRTQRFLFAGDRRANKECGVRAALDVVRRHLLNS